MKPRVMPRVSALSLAIAALGVACGAATVALARALRMDEGVTATVPAIAIPTFDVPRDRLSPLAIDDDPFSAERTPPATRYRLSGTPVAPAAHPGTDLGVTPDVLGTVIGPAGSRFATCAINGGPPQHLKVGDSIGDYVVESIERDEVGFVSRLGRRVSVGTT